MLTLDVVKGESSQPTQIQTWGYRVLNMQLERNTKEPGSLIWRSQHILNRNDGT